MQKVRVTVSGYLASGLDQVEGFVPEGLSLALERFEQALRILHVLKCSQSF